MSSQPAVTIREFAGTPPTLLPRRYSLADLGYIEAELEVSGQALSYRAVADVGQNHNIAVEPAELAPFVARVLLRCPADTSAFSGTVVVEWLNVSSGTDVAIEWDFLHRHIIRRGDAWVGVSAQKAGVDGGGIAAGIHLKRYKPERYGHLLHPGDAFSFDMFGRVGQALRAWRDGSSPLFRHITANMNLAANMNVKQILAVGHSQSAAFLATYANAVHPIAQVFDGFLLHGRPATKGSLDGTFGPRVSDERYDVLQHCPEPISSDVRVPVMLLSSETDVTVLRNAAIAQQDSHQVRLWELAGAAHADSYLLTASHSDGGQLSAAEFAQMLEPVGKLARAEAEGIINSSVHQHYVAQAALEHLVCWASDGEPPPVAPRLELCEGNREFQRDELGIAAGGVRTPWVDVPARVLSGEGQQGVGFAFLMGTTEPLGHDTLVDLYPQGLDSYVTAFEASLEQAIAAGFILEADRNEALAVAQETFRIALAS
ncbi:MAG: alpha/beta hydrolase domain-containing protein [bacterium]|nr:alpha/beta hydrolase domain-containing protein [bacterium]